MTMRINEFLSQDRETEFHLLKTRCSVFFEQASDLPLLKNLSATYPPFHKVKVRKKRDGDTFTEAFNDAFEAQHPGLRQRAIFANGETSFRAQAGDAEPFFIFPVNGYQFMYSREVTNSGREYKHVFETLFEQFGEGRGNEVISELLRFTYKSDNLYEGIASGSEIIIYGIPFFYAMKVSAVPSYEYVLDQVR